mgnify:CR=1 FL=1
MHPTQQTPLDAFVASETLQIALDQSGLVNAIFVSGRDGRASDPSDAEALQAMLHPALADYGFAIDRTQLGYLRFTSKRMMIEPAAQQAAAAADKSLKLSELRYKSGYSAFLEVLVAQGNANDAALNLIQEKRDRLLATVELYKALGGGWHG